MSFGKGYFLKEAGRGTGVGFVLFFGFEGEVTGFYLLFFVWFSRSELYVPPLKLYKYSVTQLSYPKIRHQRTVSRYTSVYVILYKFHGSHLVSENP